MSQAGHIFRKDVRQHWPEILFSFAAVAVFAWREPATWAANHIAKSGPLEIATNVMPMLSWWILTVLRVIHSEPLAGAKQFWVTRPYDWKQLLLAKVLFVVAFVDGPVMISHVYLLIKAGFSPANLFVLGTFWSQTELLVLLILPMAVLATITPNFGQMVLALLAVGLYVAGVAFLTDYIPSEGFGSGSDDLQAAVLICLCFVVVLVQYARRNTNLSRLLVGASAALILLIVVATPYEMLAAHLYPEVSAATRPVQLTFSPNKPPTPKVVQDDKDEVEIHLPILIAGVQEGMYAKVNGTMLTVEAGDGKKWSTGWKSHSQLLVPHQRALWLDFEVKKKFYEQATSNPANLHLSLALTLLKEGDVHKAIATGGELAIPGVGRCAVSLPYSDAVDCRFAFEGPALAVLKVTPSETTCPQAGKKPADEREISYAWGGSDESGPFSPIGTFRLNLWQSAAGSSWLCPGTPLEIDIPQEVQRYRQELELNGIWLNDYRKSNSLEISF